MPLLLEAGLKEKVMTIAEVLLADFDAEAVNTRRVLERMPEDKAEWRPHDKSMPLKSMALHVAALPMFGHAILTMPQMDMAVDKYPSPPFEGFARLLELAAGAGAELRSRLAAMTDEELQQPWRLLFGGQLIVEGPRYKLYRTMCFNHLIHHRGQLNVYLRLLDIKVPGIYGPSADEPFGG